MHSVRLHRVLRRGCGDARVHQRALGTRDALEPATATAPASEWLREAVSEIDDRDQRARGGIEEGCCSSVLTERGFGALAEMRTQRGEHREPRLVLGQWRKR